MTYFSSLPPNRPPPRGTPKGDLDWRLLATKFRANDAVDETTEKQLNSRVKAVNVFMIVLVSCLSTTVVESQSKNGDVMDPTRHTSRNKYVRMDGSRTSISHGDSRTDDVQYRRHVLIASGF